MATIANLTLKSDGSLEGTLATLTVSAQIAVVKNARKAKDSTGAAGFSQHVTDLARWLAPRHLAFIGIKTKHGAERICGRGLI